jgi:sugar phosphate isomerase/epimerase
VSKIERVSAALSLDGLGGDARAGFEVASGAGYEGIAIATNHPELGPEVLGESGRRHLRKTLAAQDLAVAAVRAAGPRGGLGDAKTIDRTVENVRKAIGLAESLKVGTVCVNAGAIAKDSGGVEGALRELSRLAERAGVRLAVTGDSNENLAEMLRRVDAGPLAVHFSPAGAIGAGEDPLAAVAGILDKGGIIGAMTAADAIRAGRQLRLVELGDGQVAWKELFETLRQREFFGPTIVDVRELADGVHAARNAAALLRNVMGRRT